MTRKRTLTVVLLAAATLVPVALLGARAVSGASSRQMATYAEILALIEERHVPEVEPKKVIYASVDGMLQTLDPHTNFLDDEAYREMREEQRGSFFGLGIVISKGGRYQPLRVVSPIANTPAARMGVRAGDVISHIRDNRAGVDIDTIGLTIQEAVKHLRGPRGSAVDITVDRPGLDDSIVFTIERDAIRTPAVNQTFLLEPGVGYVHIANFTETTTAELDESIGLLRAQGAEKLVLDLRGNPGGLLEQAIGIASRFLEPGELVVYTEGRISGSRQDYAALRDVPRIDWPVVVIVDYGSASASEIVAGALQDHDRALLVGSTTFGKGLVQSVYPLSENTGLALTTQKYYSPSGRTIQRPYEEEEQYFFELRGREDVEPAPDAPMFRTATGRSIPGGGGIVPDVRFAPDPPGETLVRLARISAFSRFVNPLSDADRQRYERDPSALLSEFRSFARKEVDSLTDEDLSSAESDILVQLLGELALARGGMEARDRILLDRDEVVRRAVGSFGEAERLLAAREQLLRDRRAAASARGDRRR